MNELLMPVLGMKRNRDEASAGIEERKAGLTYLIGSIQKK